MSAFDHLNALTQMYAAAPINNFYQPVMTLGKGHAEIEIELHNNLHHSAGGVHGSVYFKMLDDAAYFAVSTLEQDFFVLTTSFTTYITRPISHGKMTAVGTVANQNNSQFIAEAIVYNSEGKEIGRGNGMFLRSKIPLIQVPGYIPDSR